MATLALASSLAKRERAILREAAGSHSLRFKFNPTEYTISKSASWNRPTTAAARSTTAPQFTGSQPASLQMEIFFDAWEEADGDVSMDVETLLEWTRPAPESVNKKEPEPPTLILEWGKSIFKGFLKSVTAKYTMFRPDGTPVRASANISLEEIPDEPAPQNPTSGAVNGRGSHILAATDTLQSIAYREYGDPALWRGLAALNGIDDPLRLPPGTRILVPTAKEAAALA